MRTPKSKLHRFRLLLALAPLLLLTGCGVEDVIEFFHLRSLVTFFPAGPIGYYQRTLMNFTFVVMLFVLVPVVGFTVWFSWHYRATNTKATFWPNWDVHHLLETFLWAGPFVVISVLGLATWLSTHDLDPYKPIESDNEPIRVQAIAMDWKWLFIYPEYNVAVVNEMAIPVEVPVKFHLTSSTVMNAFMIPRLGSQIFAMSGMQTELNLMASEKGTFFGKNYQYSGDGFSGMTFQYLSTSPEDFEQWLRKVRAVNTRLDAEAFKSLAQPSQDVPVSYYSSVAPNLFERVIAGFNSGYTKNLAVGEPISTPAPSHEPGH